MSRVNKVLPILAYESDCDQWNNLLHNEMANLNSEKIVKICVNEKRVWCDWVRIFLWDNYFKYKLSFDFRILKLKILKKTFILVCITKNVLRWLIGQQKTLCYYVFSMFFSIQTALHTLSEVANVTEQIGGKPVASVYRDILAR